MDRKLKENRGRSRQTVKSVWKGKSEGKRDKIHTVQRLHGKKVMRWIGTVIM